MTDPLDVGGLADWVASDGFLADFGLGGLGLDESTAAEAFLALLVADSVDAGVGNAEHYDAAARQLERWGFAQLRGALDEAVRRDLADYDPAEAGGPAKTARERLYWLAVAIADRPPQAGRLDLRDLFAAVDAGTAAPFIAFYRRFAAVAGRDPLHGTDDAAFVRLHQPIRALLEGVVAVRRSGRPIDHDDVVTAVMALFYFLTRPIGAAAPSPEGVLAAEADPDRPAGAGPLTAAVGADDCYADAIQALRRARRSAPGVVRHAALHGLSGVPMQADPRATGLRDATLALLDAGWELRRMVRVRDEAHLEREIELAEHLARRGRVLVRATVGAEGGHLATITIGDRVTQLGLDDPHTSLVGRSLQIDDPAATAFWIAHFDQLFDDRERSVDLREHAGTSARGILELRRRLRALEGEVDAVDEIELTYAQLRILEAFRPDSGGGWLPAKQAARKANVSVATVYDTVRKVADAYGIRAGAGRTPALLRELERRGRI